MRRIAATATALALLFAAGCGGDDDQGEPIPADEAERMLDVLTLIEGNVEEGACGGAESKVRDDLRPIVARLPENVDPDVESALEDGVERLLDLIEDQCGEDEETDTDTTETDTGPAETDPAPTDTEPQDTEPEDTQPEQTQPEQTQPEQTEPEPPPPGAVPPAGDDGGAEAPGNGNAGGGAGGARRTR